MRIQLSGQGFGFFVGGSVGGFIGSAELSKKVRKRNRPIEGKYQVKDGW